MINRPEVCDLRPGHSFVEHLLDEGFDVFLVDWGRAGEEDPDRRLDDYVCDELPWAIRETLRAAGVDEVSLVGWCMGGTMCTMHAALEPAGAARNLVLLTTPVDTTGSRYARWVERMDVDGIAGAAPLIPGEGIDFANKLLKPVANHWTTYRTLWESVLDDRHDRAAFRSMARWVADNPGCPSRAWREWVGWLYRDNALVRGAVRLRGRRVDLSRIEHNVLVVTADGDHITPPENTVPLLDLVSSGDVTHLARPGGHIGLMAGSRAHAEIWPDISDWLADRS